LINECGHTGSVKACCRFRAVIRPKQGCFDTGVPMWEWLRDDDDILDSMLHIIGVVAGVLSGACMGVHSMPIQGVVSKVFAVLKGHST